MTLCDPMDCSPSWDFPGKNTGVGCHFHFQGIFLTQGSNLCLVTYSQSNINRTHVYDTGNADCDGCQTDLILRYICHLRKWWNEDLRGVCVLYTHIHNYSVLNKILPFATTLMDSEGMGIMLKEINQTDKYCMTSLRWNLKK